MTNVHSLTEYGATHIISVILHGTKRPSFFLPFVSNCLEVKK